MEDKTTVEPPTPPPPLPPLLDPQIASAGPSATGRKSIGVIVVVFTVLLLLSMVAFGLFYWQRTNRSRLIEDFQKNYNAGLKQVDELISQATVQPVNSSLILIAPLEQVCLGTIVPIEWQGDPSLTSVTLSLNTYSGYQTIGEFPVSYQDGIIGTSGRGRYSWPAGQVQSGTVETGGGYSLKISSRQLITLPDGTSQTVNVEDTSDEWFAIANCPADNITTAFGPLRTLAAYYFDANGQSYTGLDRCFSNPTPDTCPADLADQVARVINNLATAAGGRLSLQIISTATDYCISHPVIGSANFICVDGQGSLRLSPQADCGTSALSCP